MQLTRLVSTAVLTMLLSSAAIVCAQDERNDPKPPHEPRAEEPKAEKEKNEARPAARQDEAKPPKQERQEDREKQDQMKAPQRDEKSRQAGERGAQGAQSDRDGRQQTAGRGARIPDDRFRSQFGRQHSFKVSRVTVVEGQPRFEYGGYSFVLVDAWPGDWAYTDDCYIDYIDGEYFLFDLLHPGIRIAVFVVM